MEIATLILLVVILALVIGVSVRIWIKPGPLPITEEKLKTSLEESERRFKDELERMRNSLSSAIVTSSQGSMTAQHDLTLQLTSSVEQIRSNIQTIITDRFIELQRATTLGLTEMREAQVSTFLDLQQRVQTGLDNVRTDNSQNLEKIRATVEEKLTSTLENRLGESFRTVSEQLENVYKGLGEMQNLATGVGDLKRVLTNVRSRGTFGEVILGSLLEQVLVPEQYSQNIATIPGSSEIVEYAIKLPGRDDEIKYIYLPIDAKFPREDFERLQQAYELADVAAIDDARKALRRRVLDEARSICKKYIGPPYTTDFALLFLPTEGLYVEVLNIPGLSDALQSQHRVIPVGPTTLHAVLNSLQMGFRTLAIEKRTSEVWRILGAVKTEFGKFGVSLDQVSKKLREASNKLEDTSTRSRQMERHLKKVEELSRDEAIKLLPLEVSSIQDDTDIALSSAVAVDAEE